jgi:polar amino acid transport system ATP-binding protein
MDEPTASLDPARRDELGDTLERLTQSGRTLLAATHDDDFVRDYADRVVVMADGRVVEQGVPSQVLTSPRHPATRQLLSQKKNKTGRGSTP